MQKDSGQYKKLVAGIIVGIYAFVVFFAGFLHTHKADVTFGTGTKVKMEKSFQPNVNDCLSCHLMGSHQIYESFDFSLELFIHYYMNTSYQYTIQRFYFMRL